MKKYTALILVLVLTAALFAGCGCRNSRPAATVPTTMPTTVPTTAPTHAATENTTHATENPSQHTNGTDHTDTTVPGENGHAPTDTTGTAAENNRTRKVPTR